MSVIVDEVEICGQFVEDSKDQRVLFDEPPIRRLNEPLVKLETFRANLMIGYEQFQMFDRFQDEMRGIVEFLRMRMSSTSRRLQQAAFGADIVSRRSLLARVASSPTQRDSERDSGFTIFACKLNGIVFLCERINDRSTPMTEEDIAKREQIAERRKQNAYIRSKLNEGLTLGPGQKDHSFDGVASSAMNWNVVSKFQLKDQDTHLAHQILIASTTNAMDKNNEYVQIVPIAVNQTPKPVHVLVDHHFYPYQQVRHLLSALFSGQRRLIGGVYLRRWNQLKQIVDIDASVFLPRVDVDACLTYLFELISQIRIILDGLPEGTFIEVERPKQNPKHKIRVVENSEWHKFDFLDCEFHDLFQSVEKI